MYKTQKLLNNEIHKKVKDYSEKLTLEISKCTQLWIYIIWDCFIWSLRMINFCSIACKVIIEPYIKVFVEQNISYREFHERKKTNMRLMFKKKIWHPVDAKLTGAIM